MATRGAVSSLRNTLHIPATALMSLSLLLAMVFGSRLLGNRFRWYSYATLAVLLLFGFLAALHGGRVANNESTPWMGIEERVNIYATMLWFAVLSISLLRASGFVPTRRPGRKIVVFGRASRTWTKSPS